MSSSLRSLRSASNSASRSSSVILVGPTSKKNDLTKPIQYYPELNLPGFSAELSSVLFEGLTGWSIKSSSSMAFNSSRGFLSEFGCGRYKYNEIVCQVLWFYFTKISRKSAAGMTLFLSLDNAT